MAIKGQRLGKVRLSQTTVANAESIATNPAGFDSCVDYIVLYNSHDAAVTVDLCIVDDNAGSPGTPAATDVFYEVSLAAKESLLLGKEDLGIWLNDTNDAVCAYASVANVIHAWAYGIKITDQA